MPRLPRRFLALAATLSLPAAAFVLAVPPVRAALVPAATEAPAAASWGDGRNDLFWRGSDGTVVHQALVSGGVWSSPQSLGGSATSQPGAVASAVGRLNVVVRGGDGAVWHKGYGSGRWSSWQSLGGSATSAPAIVALAADQFAVYVRGTDNALWERRYTGGQWSAWRSQGGVLQSGPAATVVDKALGTVQVFARAGGGQLYGKTILLTGLPGVWRSFGGSIVGEPAATSPAARALDVFARGTNNALYARSLRNGSWSQWYALGGALTSAPAAATPAANQVSVFVRGTDGRFWWRLFTGTGWSAWRLVDPVQAFRGLGTWVDLYDSALDPAAEVPRMKSYGVRTIYLQTARYTSTADIDPASEAAQWLDAAHANGIRVVGWYLPDFLDASSTSDRTKLADDVRRSLAIARYVSPSGQRFDSLGIDIESPWSLSASQITEWNTRVGKLLSQVDAGTTMPISAIVVPPLQMELNPARWGSFPWSAVGRYADVVQPMNYLLSGDYCSRGASYCTYYAYTLDNVRKTRSLTGRPVHVAGGVASDLTIGQVTEYVNAGGAGKAIGGGLYDYATTKPRPGLWSYLAPVNRW